MRLNLILPVFLLLSPLGCSFFIANSGKDLDAITTRSMAHKELGTPVAAGEEDGHSYEEFKHYGKVQRWYTAGMGMAMSLGLYEAILFPIELMRVARGFIIGDNIRLYYNAKGEVVSCHLNGWFNGGRGFSDKDSDLPNLAPAALDASLTLIP